MSIFSNPDTLIRLNPETYIKFDGSEMLLIQNLYSENGVRIKYDILLILYELMEWKAVGELIAPWPPDDQEKIIHYLELFLQSEIVIHQDSKIRERSESGLSQSLGANIHINAENHQVLLKDYVRMTAYRRAIEQAVTPETIAMDLGCGTGILSFFAAKAGASKIYAVEKRPDIILLAKALAKANGVEAQIEFLEGASSHLQESLLKPKPNLLIAEILGSAILEENILEFTLDARDRFLAPGGKMIPERLEIDVFAFNSQKQVVSPHLEVKELKALYGLDFGLLGDLLTSRVSMRTERYQPLANQTMSTPTQVCSLDFNTLSHTVFTKCFELEMLETGLVTGFCAYFRAFLDPQTVLTNSPWAPQTHWVQLVFSLPTPKAVEKREILKFDLIYDGNLKLNLLP